MSDRQHRTPERAGGTRGGGRRDPTTRSPRIAMPGARPEPDHADQSRNTPMTKMRIAFQPGSGLGQLVRLARDEEAHERRTTASTAKSTTKIDGRVERAGHRLRHEPGTLALRLARSLVADLALHRRLPDRDVARLLAEQDPVDDARRPAVDRDRLRAHRVDGLHREAHGRLADHAAEVDALHDRLDVDRRRRCRRSGSARRCARSRAARSRSR